MGARLRRSGRAGIVTILVAVALVASAWLAYATSAPGGSAGSSGGVTTTTVKGSTTSSSVSPTSITAPTSTTTIQSTTTTTECKPGHGFGDKNHCHTGPPGHDHDHDNTFILIIFIQHFCNWWGNIFGGHGMQW